MYRWSAEYFTVKELACKGSGKLILDTMFDRKLYELRKEFGQAMTVNSCCRSLSHNNAVGGKPKSLHICDYPAWPELNGTAAIDIGYKSKAYRDKLAKVAWGLGWRIGFNRSFLHLDIGAFKGVSPKLVFKYDNVTDAELEAFKKGIV